MRLRYANTHISLGLALIAIGCAGPALLLPAAYVVDVQGHRGARGLMPENTLPAFELALELGVTTLELDLGLSSDGVVVVSHNPHIAPDLCLEPGGARIEAELGPLLRALTFAEIKRYDCGSLNPNPGNFPEPPRINLPGTRMPTLAEVYALAAERRPAVRFNVEIKARPGSRDTAPLHAFVGAVVAVIRKANAVERTTVQSFHWRALEIVKQHEPRLRTAGVVAPYTLDRRWLGGLDPKRFPDFLSLLKSANYVDELSPNWRQLLPGRKSLGVTVDALHSSGYRVVPWTVNDRKTMRTLLGLRVDGIISDYPDVLIDEVLLAGGRVSPGGRVPPRRDDEYHHSSGPLE